jgi:hypothetical protein
MFNTFVGAGARAVSRYGSGSDSDQKMWLLAAPAPQHCLFCIHAANHCEIENKLTQDSLVGH